MTKKEFFESQKEIAKTHKHGDVISFMLCNPCWFVKETEERENKQT